MGLLAAPRPLGSLQPCSSLVFSVPLLSSVMPPVFPSLGEVLVHPLLLPAVRPTEPGSVWVHASVNLQAGQPLPLSA